MYLLNYIFSNTQQVSSISLAFVGMGIVFSGLLILSIAIFIFRKIVKNIERKPKKDLEKNQNKSITKEEVVAISMALHIHFSKIFKDKEYILTLKKYTKNLTPWTIEGRGSMINSYNRNRR